MPLLLFTLSPEQIVEVHDAVVCLSKFNEVVSFEASLEKLILSTLNLACSAYASFTLPKSKYFSRYEFDSRTIKMRQPRSDGEVRFTCQMYNKALLSVFKKQLKEMRDKVTAVEGCECYVQEESDQAECRFIVKMICRHGVTKTYKLTYEESEVKHAVFSQATLQSKWTINALTLRSFVEYFGAGTEQLDIYSQDGQTTFLGYTEKVVHGKDILKQPLQTSVSIDNLDFFDLDIAKDLRIGITVKDFKSIAAHAETLKANVSAIYSMPFHPMLIHYEEGGMRCEYVLATAGEYSGPPVTASTENTNRASNAADTAPSAQAFQSRAAQDQQARETPLGRSATTSFERGTGTQEGPRRPSPPPPRPTLDPDSLFVPQYDEDDRQWGEKNLDEEDETVGWSASAFNTRSFDRGGGTQQKSAVTSWEESFQEKQQERLPPTQRLSEIETMFDD